VAADVALDYESVMASRVELRPWEQSGWPADDFTVEQDLDDVVMLESRHRSHDAFTYAVLTPDESLPAQIATIEDAGLALRFTIAEPGKPGVYRAYS